MQSAHGSTTDPGNTINCADNSGDCSQDIYWSTTLELTAVPDTNYSFDSWSNCPAPVGNICTITANGPLTVTAGFIPIIHTLSASVPAGSGTITATGIDTSTGDTEEAIQQGSTITLTATPDPEYHLSSWGGACSGNASTCELTISGTTSVSAAFAINQYPVTIIPSGLGTVSGSGFDCGDNCQQSFPYNSSLTLTATPDKNATFSSWTNCPKPTANTCTLTITEALEIQASFLRNPNPFLFLPAVINGAIATGK